MGTFWIDMVSGARHDIPARLALAGLRPAAAVYGMIVDARNRRYDAGRSEIHRATCPVVSVGNITVGGTGKTPFVEWIVRRLETLGRKPAVLSRGYGGSGGDNEEARLLAENCPGVPMLCDPDRVAAAERACREHAADCLVLDDGFQHRRLHRDLDIVLVDATRPFGTGRFFPAGILREGLSGLRRADAIVITRCDKLDVDSLDALHNGLAELAPDAVIARAVHRPAALVGLDGASEDADWLGQKSVLAFSGVGNPGAFEQTLLNLRSRPLGAVRFGDHHLYSADDVERLAAHAKLLEADAVVTTQKDAVKLREMWPETPRLLWLRVEIDVISGADELENLLARAVGSQ